MRMLGDWRRLFSAGFDLMKSGVWRNNDLEASRRIKTADSVTNGLVVVVATVGILLLISWVFAHWDLDRRIAARFYTSETRWYLENDVPWRWLYRFGTLPGIALTLAALIGSVVTRLRKPESLWHRYLLLVFLTSVIGAGLLVNGILKPYWGRPRPNQIREFGGPYTYRHALSPGIPGQGKSFPSGHATMGFLFVSLVYLRRKSKPVAWCGGLGGMAYGGLLSATRVVQGAHFTTDCIWSLGVIWLTASLLYYHLLRIPAQDRKTPKQLAPRWQRVLLATGVVTLLLIIALALTRRPYFETHTFWPGKNAVGIEQLRVGLADDYIRGGVRIVDRGPLRIMIHARGFAWLGAGETANPVSTKRSETVYEAVYRMRKEGFFSELSHELEVVVPAHLKNEFSVVFIDKTGKAIDP